MNDVSASAGIVYIVGAGPGDPALITLRGAQTLREADVVFHDELLDRRLLDLASPSCELVYVGKEEDAPAARSSRSTNKSLSARARDRPSCASKGEIPWCSDAAVKKPCT